MDLRPETLAALSALRAVVPFVRERRGAEEVREKAPNDIVTGTDVLVQSVLQQVLHEQQPDIAFVGEEVGANVIPDARRFWLVDPICGTTNYAVGLPLFAINVALVSDGQIVASAVADGSSGELYAAEWGRGAWHIGPSETGQLQVRPASSLVSVDPSGHPEQGLRDFGTAFAIEALTRRRWEVRAIGSTLALMYLARGFLGGAVYTPLGEPLHFAAGALLAKEAGAIVTDHTGADWRLDSPICIAAARVDLHVELMMLAREVYEGMVQAA